MIKEIISDYDIKDAERIIRNSFITVANEFGITKENAPTNAAFITSNIIKNSIEKGLNLYGLFINNKIIGCIGIEDAKSNGIFYIERLAVLPEYRHKGYGKTLLDNAVKIIKNKNGKKVSIGIIDKNIKLKNWYLKYGFIEKEVKTFKHLPFDVCFMEFGIY
jgi:diamine N-acetyltransferase